jgi:hypothetical protein
VRYNIRRAMKVVLRANSRARLIWRKEGMSKIHTYFGFKNGKLVTVLQSLDGDAKEALDCSYYVTNPQELEKQIETWKKEKSA